jgi:hypothetical protein
VHTKYLSFHIKYISDPDQFVWSGYHLFYICVTFYIPTFVSKIPTALVYKVVRYYLGPVFLHVILAQCRNIDVAAF